MKCQEVNDNHPQSSHELFQNKKKKSSQELFLKEFNLPSCQIKANLNYFEIPPHPSQNGCHQEIWQQMLETTWEKRNLIHSWWGKLMQSCENQKIKGRMKNHMKYHIAIILLSTHTEVSITYHWDSNRLICSIYLLLFHFW